MSSSGSTPPPHQLGLVELLVSALHAAGCVLAVVGIVLMLLSWEQGDERERCEADALLTSAVLWLLGSVLGRLLDMLPPTPTQWCPALPRLLPEQPMDRSSSSAARAQCGVASAQSWEI